METIISYIFFVMFFVIWVITDNPYCYNHLRKVDL